MQSLYNSRIGDFTRGGQVTIHFLRMIGQVIRQFFAAIALLYVVMTGAIWMTISDPYDRYLAFRWVGAHAGVALGNGDNQTYLRRRDEGFLLTTIGNLARSAIIEQRSVLLVRQWGYAMGGSLGVGVLIVILVMVWLLRFGASQRREENIRGEGLLESESLNRLLKEDGRAGTLRIAGIPMLKDTENLHVLVNGSPGSGKTTTLLELLKTIRARGDRCICYSPSGDFIEWFFRNGDTLLNPFDARCPTWNLWEECRTAADHYMVASALIPDPSDKEPMWNNATRQLVSALTEKLGRAGNREAPSITQLLHYVNRATKDELSAFLADTDARGLVDVGAENTSGGIRINAVTFVNSLRHIPQGQTRFSIRDWVARDAGKDWIFLNARPNQLDSVRPLLSMWLQVFVNSLMSLPPSSTRRIWLIIDELPSLQKIGSLGDFFAQARKYGGCGVIAYQQLSQLRERYGRDGALGVIGNIGTWVCMRQNDFESAELISKTLGEMEVMENQQGISYGANEIRDGVSLNAQRKTRRIVLPSEIMQLDNLEGYLKLPGKVPVAHFHMRRQPMKSVAPAFLQGEVSVDADPMPPIVIRPRPESIESGEVPASDATARSDEPNTGRAATATVAPPKAAVRPAARRTQESGQLDLLPPASSASSAGDQGRHF